jgi:hypothetical protein
MVNWRAMAPDVSLIAGSCVLKAHIRDDSVEACANSAPHTGLAAEEERRNE